MSKIRWPISAAVFIYLLWGLWLVAQKPGLQYDEALLTSDGVHLLHSLGTFKLNSTPDAWVCPWGRCVPLMSAFYVGALKSYFVLPLFAVFGPRTPVIRLGSLLLGAIALWGFYRLVAQTFGQWPGALVAFILAMNPAFLDQTAFDNNAVGAVMVGMGLTAAGISLYIRKASVSTALLLGAAMGFTIWARANTLWILAAGAVATALVLGRRALIPFRHWAALVGGGVIGGAPFLIYQIVSGGATWRAQASFHIDTPVGILLRQRLTGLAGSLFSDAEHRAIWAGPPLPVWQLWFFPILILAACVLCLSGTQYIDEGRRLFARALALTFAIATTYMCLVRLQIAEHHLIMLLPLASMVVVCAYFMAQARERAWLRAIGVGVLSFYCVSAVYWNVAAIRGLKRTGGVGVWSNADLDLARYLDKNLHDHEIKLLDWGFLYNLYTLTDERLDVQEIYAQQSEDRSFAGTPWIDEIREGGIFVVHGPHDRQFPRASTGFLRVLAAARPDVKTWSVSERSGATYAEVIDVRPNSIRESGSEGPPPDSLSMGDPGSGEWLSGFYGPEDGAFRWTKRQFSARLGVNEANVRGGSLVVALYIPDAVIQKVGPMSLTADIDGHALPSQVWSQPGRYTYRCNLDPAWMAPGAKLVSFTLDKSAPPGAIDQRELGIIVREISIEER